MEDAVGTTVAISETAATAVKDIESTTEPNSQTTIVVVAAAEGTQTVVPDHLSCNLHNPPPPPQSFENVPPKEDASAAASAITTTMRELREAQAKVKAAKKNYI